MAVPAKEEKKYLNKNIKVSRSRCMDIIAYICKMDSFGVPTIFLLVKACHKVMDKSEELLEQLFVKKPYLTLKEIEEAGCYLVKVLIKPRNHQAISGGSVQPDVFVDGVPFGNSMQNEEQQKEGKKKKEKDI